MSTRISDCTPMMCIWSTTSLNERRPRPSVRNVSPTSMAMRPTSAIQSPMRPHTYVSGRGALSPFMRSEARLGLAGHDGAVRHELRALAQERHVHLVGGAVALLGDDELRLAGLGRVGLVDDLAIDEQHDVGILLDAARIPQVRELRAAGAAALLDGA